jgi:hypothetical protein
MQEIQLVNFICKIYIFTLFDIIIINKNLKKKKESTSLTSPHKSILIGIMIFFNNFIFIFQH